MQLDYNLAEFEMNIFSLVVGNIDFDLVKVVASQRYVVKFPERIVDHTSRINSVLNLVPGR